MIFRYYIIGGDGNTYEQQVEVDDRAGRSFTQLEADAQRQINNQLAESGATQLTLPDTSRGTNNYVPEIQRNFDARTGTSNVGGRTINLSNPNAPTITQGGTSPLLPSGANIPPAVQPRITMTNFPNQNETFYGDAFGYDQFSGTGEATPGLPNDAGQTSAGNVPFDINNQLMMQGATQGPAPSPFAFNPEFSAPGTIDTRTPVEEFEGDVMEGGGGGGLFRDENLNIFDTFETDTNGEDEQINTIEEEDPDSLPIDINSLSDLQKEELRLLGNALTADPKNLKQFIADRGENYARKVLSANGFSSIQIDNLVEGTTLEEANLTEQEVIEKKELIDNIINELPQEETKLTPFLASEESVRNEVLNRVPGLGNVSIEDVSGEFLDFDVTDALSNFLATSPALGINLPVDANGNRRNITPDDFPGFPGEILDPNNLFIRVTETTSIPDADGNMIPGTSTRVVPNPAVELLLAQYAERVRALTDLQGSADDILQAQVSASGGLFGGPTGSLSINELEDLERETRSIQASGGRLVQERVIDAEGNATGQFREVLTPLGEEERLSRQQRLAEEALRQSGGLLGGFFSPLDAAGQPLDPGQQRFVQGFTPQQLLQRQEEELRRGRQQELEVLERQRERDLQLARINQSSEQFRNVADLYSNPAQLAAIVASGGSPLLRGQLPGSAPIPQGPMQTTAMTPQQAPGTFNITNPSGTVFDPNFVPVGGRTQEGDLRRQEANPFNVRDFSGVTEQRLRNLSDIELARAQGEAAAQGITPFGLAKIGEENTPGDTGLDLTGYLAPRTLFN